MGNFSQCISVPGGANLSRKSCTLLFSNFLFPIYTLDVYLSAKIPHPTLRRKVSTLRSPKKEKGRDARWGGGKENFKGPKAQQQLFIYFAKNENSKVF